MAEPLPVLCTIGYSKLKSDALADILKSVEVATVVDVRSIPYSSRYRCFNREALAKKLGESGLSYVWMGNELGGLKGGDYAPIENVSDMDAKLLDPSFRSGCEALRQKLDSGNACLLCAENDPLDCHRAILVSHLLRKLHPEIDIRHIWKPKDQAIFESQNDLDARALAALKGKASMAADLDRILDHAYAALNRRFAHKRRKRQLSGSTTS